MCGAIFRVAKQYETLTSSRLQEENVFESSGCCYYYQEVNSSHTTPKHCDTFSISESTFSKHINQLSLQQNLILKLNT